MKFAIVDGGGDSLWSHDGSSIVGSEPGTSIDVDVANGFFTVQLGDTTIPNMTETLSADNLMNVTDAALRIWVCTLVTCNPGDFELLTPDQPISSSAFALVSESVSAPLTLSAMVGDNASVLRVQKADATAFDNYASLSFKVANQLGHLGDYDTTMITDVLEAANNQHGLGLWTRQTAQAWGERMRIDGNGNVGIGTTNPSGKLNVVGGPIWAINGWSRSIVLDDGGAIEFGRGNPTQFGIGASGSALYHWLSTTDDGTGFVQYYMLVDSNGNVDLGTPESPLDRVHIHGALHLSGTTRDISVPPTETIQFGHYDGSTFAEAMRISPGGNVGIGTMSPVEKLSVNGAVESTSGGFKFPDSSVQTTAAVLPSGVIVMWSGTIASIPSGWALCDGTNGTPDLRDRFIFGVSTGENPGANGGSSMHSHSVNAHNHTVDPPSTQLPDHTHAVDPPMTDTSVPVPDIDVTAGTGFSVAADDDHHHTVDIASFSSSGASQSFINIGSFQSSMGGGGSTQSTSHLPPYFKLAFIMKL